MALILKVNTVDRSAYVNWRTLVKTEVLTKEVDRMEFEIIRTPAKSSIPDVNDEVTLEEDSTLIFGGVIVERNEVIKGGILIGYQYKCKDYSQYLDRKLVVRSYEDQTARQIFLDIISTYTTGFTTVNVPAVTPTIKSIKFNYEQVTRALTQVCDLIGWDWYVDSDRDIHLFAEDTSPAPFNLTDINDTYDFASLEINKTILQLKNSIYVRGGDYKKAFDASDTPDVYVGDGTQQTFFLAYQYAQVTVSVNDVVVNLGADQEDPPESVDAVYNFNEKFVRFTGMTIGDGDEVKIYGNALIPIIGLVRDQTSIATYGEYQAALVDKTITSVAEAQTRAMAEAKKYASSVNAGVFKTHRTGLRVGMFINIQSTVRSINRTFKISRIVGKTRTSGTMEYTVSIIASGNVTFTDIMVSLLTKDNKDISIDALEVLQRIEAFEETFDIADDIDTPTNSNAPYVWDTALWNLSTWG